MKEVNPNETTRATAFRNWIKAPQPMVTLIKNYDIKHLVTISQENKLKLNMLLCYCIGKAALPIKEFYLLPEGEKLYLFDKLAINVIVKSMDGSLHFCDIPFSSDIKEFNKNYLERTEKVYKSNKDLNLEDYMIIGTSTVRDIYLNGIINMYSGVFNNPFLAWGKYKKKKNKIKLPVSFQFHHVQMDGEQAGQFLNNLDFEINNLKILG